MTRTKVDNEWKTIVTQAFYGNRVSTEVKEENLDRFILGYIDSNIPMNPKYKIDRTMVRLPEDNNLVIMYNKYEEEKMLNELKNYEIKPLAFNPETNEKLYSRCIGCRLDGNGNLCDLEKGDFELFAKYLVA